MGYSMQTSKRSKFNNVKTFCGLGHKHASKGEASKCLELHLLLRVKELNLESIEYEKVYTIKCNGVKICTHKPDFTLNYIDHIEVVEYKGVATSTWKLKRKLFMACYPAIKYNTVYK